MPPFSNKKKKLQLQQKRQMKRERGDDPNAFYRTIMQTQFRGKPVGGANNPQNQKLIEARRNADPAQRSREKFADLQFFKDTDEEIKQRKEESFLPLTMLEENQLEVDAETAQASLDMPKRPPWNKSFTKEQLDRQEQVYFKEFVNKLLEQSAVTDKKLSYFDLNLDTWRQLWRVLEMSELITIIVDIRHPLFHFPPPLYNHIVKDLGKIVIIVLNKIDLVPASLVIAWNHYLKSQYPEAHIIPFASYAGMKTKTNGKRVGNMRMAVDGAKRFMLEVERVIGSDKIDFSSWKEKIKEDSHNADDDDTSDEDDEQENGSPVSDLKKPEDEVVDNDNEDDDDDDDDEKNFGAEALKKAEQIKVKNDTAYYAAEKFKDGLLTIGCVGHPNVGKSSFMNALIGKKVVSVSRTPGHTKHFQTIFLTPNVRLCDCPGLVFPSYYPKQLQVLMGCYPISQLREPYSSIQYLAERVNMVEKLNLKPVDEIRHFKPALNDRNYTSAKVIRKEAKANENNVEGEEDKKPNVPLIECKQQPDIKTTGHKDGKLTSDSWSAYTICESWAVVRGFLTAKAGRPDVYRAANHLLRMALDGRTLCMTAYPPDYVAQRALHWSRHEDVEKTEKIQGRQNIINGDDDGY